MYLPAVKARGRPSSPSRCPPIRLIRGRQDPSSRTHPPQPTRRTIRPELLILTHMTPEYIVPRTGKLLQGRKAFLPPNRSTAFPYQASDHEVQTLRRTSIEEFIASREGGLAARLSCALSGPAPAPLSTLHNRHEGARGRIGLLSEPQPPLGRRSALKEREFSKKPALPAERAAASLRLGGGERGRLALFPGASALATESNFVVRPNIMSRARVI